MTAEPVVDAHLHLWDRTSFRYPWLADPGGAGLPDTYLPADWRRDAGPVDVAETVHVQAELDHADDPVRETAWLASLAARGAVPGVCVGYADLRAPDLDAVLDRHQRYPLFRGIRQQAWYDPASTRADQPRDNLLADARWVRGLDRLAARGLTFDLQVWPYQLARASEIFRDRPELTVVVEHTGLPVDPDPESRAQWRTGLRRFAEQVPRSVLKISALGLVSPDWDMRVLAPLVHEAIALFGPDRCMFGSNFPVDATTISYPALWQRYRSMTAGYSEAERAQLLRGTARRVYRTAGTG